METETREQTRRDIPDVTELASEMVEDLTGIKMHSQLVVDVVDSMSMPKKKIQPAYSRTKAQRRKDRQAEKKRRAKAKLDIDEVKLSALKIRLMAGDKNHPLYEKRLAAAKKNVRLATALPVVARQKWANTAFQKEMEEKGHVYNPAQYRGWLPYSTAVKVQREVVKARSRGEYEFFVKLYELKFLPARPDRVYEEEWTGWGDFLGVQNIFAGGINIPFKPEEYRPFYEALTFVRAMKLKSHKAWQAACRSQQVPMDIPMDPHIVYPDLFKSWEHWLGTDTALDAVTNKDAIQVVDLWVLYRDGRSDAFWWAKMSSDKYEAFVQVNEIQVERVYEFEGGLSDKVWAILEQWSETYEDDKRERFIERPDLFGHIKSEMDNILKWRQL